MSKQVKIVGGVTTVEDGEIKHIEGAILYGVREDIDSLPGELECCADCVRGQVLLSFDALLSLRPHARRAGPAPSGFQPPLPMKVEGDTLVLPHLPRQPDSLICGAGPGYREPFGFEEYSQLSAVILTLVVGALLLIGLAGAETPLAHAGWALGAFFALVGSGVMVMLYLDG